MLCLTQKLMIGFTEWFLAFLISTEVKFFQTQSLKKCHSAVHQMKWKFLRNQFSGYLWNSSDLVFMLYIYRLINIVYDLQFMKIDQNKINRQSTFHIGRGNGSHLLKIFQVYSKKKSTNLFSPMLQVRLMKKMVDTQPFMNS